MKKKITFKPVHSIWLVFVAVLPLLGACQKENEMGEKGTVSLNEIPEHREYADLPLIGTKWQLIGFANAKTGRIRKIEETLKNKEFFTLVFKETGEIQGKASVNAVYGKYELIEDDRKNLSMLQFGNMSEAQEHPDGYLFIEKMKEVNRFNITYRGLSLYYDSNNYLLFNPLIN